MNVISRLLLGGELEAEVLMGAERSTLMRVDEPLRQYSSFFLRLLAATVVATAGIASDSSTTIIGAMLIAPLMSPMLGCALATTMGRPREAFRTLALVVGGMALVVVASMGVTAVIPVAADMDTNSQVLARVSPRLVDLIIAMAAGFMAALASLRADIPDAVPGVAISASIVPPLCVVGAGIYEGAPDAATEWLAGTDYRVEELAVDGGDVRLRIAGHGSVPELGDLSGALAEKNAGVESVSLSVMDERRVAVGG